MPFTFRDKYHITGPSNLQGQSMFTYLENYDWNNVSEAKLKEMYSMQYEGIMDFNCLSGHASTKEVRIFNRYIIINPAFYSSINIKSGNIANIF